VGWCVGGGGGRGRAPRGGASVCVCAARSHPDIDSHPPRFQKVRRGPGGHGRGVCGRRQGMAGQRADAPTHTSELQAPLVQRAPEGPGGLRDRHTRASLGVVDLAGGRARRRPATPAAPQATPTRPPGHAKGAGTEVPAPHSATTSSRLRLNQAQPWRRRMS